MGGLNHVFLCSLITAIQTLQALSYLLEKHIRDILLAHFEEHHPISIQHYSLLVTGGKSTAGALLDATDQWFRELEQGHDVCTIFFGTTFHIVPCRPLL